MMFEFVNMLVKVDSILFMSIFDNLLLLLLNTLLLSIECEDILQQTILRGIISHLSLFLQTSESAA